MKVVQKLNELTRNFLLDVGSVEFCTRLIMELVRACQSSREADNFNVPTPIFGEAFKDDSWA